MIRTNKKVTAIDAVTATTTSGAINVQGARALGFLFKRANHTAGSTAFTVEGTIDGGSNWFALNVILKNVTNTNAQTLTRVASVSLASNTAEYCSINLQDFPLEQIRVTATETTDGTHTALVYVKY